MPGDENTAVLIVQYDESGWVAPLQPQASALQNGVTLQSLGYTKLQGAELLRWQVERRSATTAPRSVTHRLECT